MHEGSVVALTIIIGLILAPDMDNPVDKIAYTFMLICVL